MIVAVAAALLVGVGPAAPDDAPRRSVTLRWDAQTRGCAAQVNGIDTGDPDSEAGRAALLRALPDRQVRVPLRGIAGVPYRCVGSVVSALEAAGYRGVSLGADAPPVARP